MPPLRPPTTPRLRMPPAFITHAVEFLNYGVRKNLTPLAAGQLDEASLFVKRVSSITCKTLKVKRNLTLTFGFKTLPAAGAV